MTTSEPPVATPGAGRDRAPVRWGILATGTIAHAFARDLALLPEAELVAVGSRTLASAEAFTREHGGRPHGCYEDLIADDDVDVVYVATPHSLHHAQARAALLAGRHVLCEKPFTLGRDSAADLVEVARAQGRFLMEAMWTACHPVVRELTDRLAAGEFGVPRQLYADLGWRVERPPTDRLLAPSLGGGALMDLAVYPLTFAHLVLGEALELHGTAEVNDDGVDLDVVVAGRYAGGALAAMTASMTSYSPRTASVATTTGRLDLPTSFHHPAYATWTPEVGEPERIIGTTPLIGAGYGNEAAEVMRCVRAGLLESPLVPHAQTLAIMGQLDDLRAQVGVRHPTDPLG